MTERTLLTFFLPKIHKKLFKIPGRPVAFNCDTPTGKLSKFLDHHLKTVMQSSWLKIKYSGDFPRKMKQIKNLPVSSIHATVVVGGLYPIIPQALGLKAFEEALEKRILSRSALVISLSSFCASK